MYKVRMITNYCNLCMFLTTKNLTHRKVRWWEQLSKLDLEIEYCPRKKNPADESFQCLDYMDTADNKKEKTLYTMSYVTRSFIKRGEAQKAIENARQTIQ